jgi:HEAT repeat protein
MIESPLTERVTAILLSEDGAERIGAMAALRDSAPVDTLDSIISLLSSPEQKLRRRAGSSLSFFRDQLEPRAGVLAEHLLHHSDPRIRLSCAIVLMNVPAPPVTEAYRCALGDSFDKVAQIACLELGSRGGVENADALIRVLDHPSWRVRLEACKALITQGKGGQAVVVTLETMGQQPEASIYDAECDDFERIEQEVAQETGESPPWGRCWGKLQTILEQARNLAKPGDTAERGVAPNVGPATLPGNSGVTEGPPLVS